MAHGGYFEHWIKPSGILTLDSKRFADDFLRRSKRMSQNTLATILPDADDFQRRAAHATDSLVKISRQCRGERKTLNFCLQCADSEMVPKCFAARDGFGEFAIAGLLIYHTQRGKTTTANLRARLTHLAGKFPRRDFAIDFTKSSETIRVVSKS